MRIARNDVYVTGTDAVVQQAPLRVMCASLRTGYYDPYAGSFRHRCGCYGHQCGWYGHQCGWYGHQCGCYGHQCGWYGRTSSARTARVALASRCTRCVAASRAYFTASDSARILQSTVQSAVRRRNISEHPAVHSPIS
eukprot:1069650-Prorocentrum_minimum.AAC.1